MASSRLTSSLSLVQERVDELASRARATRDLDPGLLEHTLAQLQDALAELEEADAEIASQHDDLIRSRAQLEGERRRYRELFSLAPDCYIVTDQNGMIADANNAATFLLGVREEHLLGKPLATYVSARARRSFRDALLTMQGREVLRDWETEIVPRHGDPTPVSVTVSLVTQADGETSALHWLMRDISERRKEEQQTRSLHEELELRVRERTSSLEQAELRAEELLKAEHAARMRAEHSEAELRKSNDAKDEFLGLVSHELRTPLSVLYGGIKVLRARIEELDVHARSELLNDMETEAERLRRLMEELMMVARVELDQAIDVEPVLLQRLVKRVADAHANVRVTANGDLPPASADPTFVEQIVRNLIENARKYGDPSAPIDVHVQKRGESEIVLRVLDRGPGLPPADLERIFERFYRARGGSSKVRGAGLGLTVCKRLVEAQSGRIWASAREGGGLEIAVTLPVHDAT